MRLTKKQNNKLYPYIYSDIDDTFEGTPINKLGQLEDIEEELGIDLITYHRLMSKLYCGTEDTAFYKGTEVIIYEIDYCKKKVILYSPKEKEDIVVGFSSYGKTWALTKEELCG